MESGVDGDELKSNGLQHPRGRIIRKDFRPTRATSFPEPSIPGMSPTKGLVNFNRAAKNVWRPRNSPGRDIPKKDRAGGKGTCGKLGDEMELPWVDPRDPNYDSDRGVDAEVWPGVGFNKTTKFNTLVPEMSKEDVRKTGSNESTLRNV